MSRGLHMLGYDWKSGASSMTAALAEGLAEGATHQRADAGAGQVKIAQAQAAQAQAQAQAQAVKPGGSSDMVWYVATGAAVVAAFLILLRRSR